MLMELQQLTPISAFVLYAAGLLTSLTPCCLSMLPLTFAYIGGLQSDGAEPSNPGGGGDGAPAAASGPSFLPALSFTAGLACAFAALGVGASTLGYVYGESSGDGSLAVLRVAASAVAAGMGLNLLGLLPFELPSVQLDTSTLRLPAAARAFAFGASSALVASPCASPVLITILSYVAAVGDPLFGGALLVCYTLGYTTPVLFASLLATGAAGLSTGAGGRIGGVMPASGSWRLARGTYNILVATIGAV